jgi:glycosyltransferase involved in cell wall biosynthesis
MSALGVSVIISAFNYKTFIDRAIASALSQSAKPLEVIVVDDGSTDGTADHVERGHAGLPVRVIRQANQGQLSAFVTGVRAARGEIIAFLDPDDTWAPHKLATCLDAYRMHPDVNFVCSNLRFEGLRSGCYFRKEATRWVGPSVLLGLYAPLWLGAVTSSITLRRTLAERLLDIPAELLPFGKVGADTWLAGGADILDGRKFFINQPLVNYHFHGNNDSLGNSRPDKRVRMRLNEARIISFYRMRAGIPIEMDDYLLPCAKYEFRAKPHPSVFEWHAYSGIIKRTDLPWNKQFELRWALTRHFYKQHWRRRTGRALPDEAIIRAAAD